MKILVYSICMWPSHFETDLEIAQRHSDDGHEVFFLRCTGVLPVCTHNVNCPNAACWSCRSRFEKGISRLKPSPVKIFQMEKPAFCPDWPIFLSVNDLKCFEYDGVPLGLAAASSLISRLNRDHKFDTVLNRAIVEQELTSAYIVMHNARLMIEKLKPDRVVLFNGRFSVLKPLVDVCIERGVEYEVHERGASHHKFSTRVNESIHSIAATEREIFSLWGDGGAQKENEALQWFHNRRGGKNQQWYSFVATQDPSKLPKDFDLTKRNILICNSTIEEYCTIPGWERTEIGEDNEVVEKILLAFKNESDFVFYLRCHPNLKATYNTQIRELHDLAARHQNVVFIPPESDIGSYALLDACEKIITFGSTMGAEAVVYKKPSILVGPALYQGLGITYNAESLEVLTALIRALDLPAKSVIGALQYGYWEATRGTPFKYYQADDLASGKFKGKEIKSAFLPRIFSKLYRTIKLL